MLRLFCRMQDATPEDESEGLADADHDSEATPLCKPKGKAKTGQQGKGVLPSSSRSTDYESVPKREFEEFSLMMDVPVAYPVQYLGII
ncbi:hypothetical protein DVH24_035495 [Malus domestica]|uniref:Uncharacterized protein n=1 Tax=Malus domestica TaxID=3750 RepID=A0A498JBJ7_MALDO|nr:hypothetical protein DVH24_035495 [Malus domestica]